MDVMKFQINLMQAMYNEVVGMKNEYIHKDLSIKEDYRRMIWNIFLRRKVYALCGR